MPTKRLFGSENKRRGDKIYKKVRESKIKIEWIIYMLLELIESEKKIEEKRNKNLFFLTKEIKFSLCIFGRIKNEKKWLKIIITILSFFFKSLCFEN